MTRRSGTLGVVCAAVVALGFAPPADAMVTFQATNFGVATHPASVAIGDFDGDGIADLVVANPYQDAVSFLYGTGGGSFAAPVTVGVGDFPIRVAVGDIDGDGRSDVAVANIGSDNVSVIYGGPPAPVVSYAVGDQPVGVVLSDFDGDGDLDLVVANSGSSSVSVRYASPAGLSDLSTYYPVADNPVAVAVGDFNGDSEADLAATSVGTDEVTIRLSEPSNPVAYYPTGNVPFTLAVGDFNADGSPDLAVSNRGTSDVSILLGGPDGTFTGPTYIPVGLQAEAVAVGDFNGDGDPDLAVADYQADVVSLLLGGPGAGFTGPTDYAVGTAPTSVAVGDLDGDGDADLAVANELSDDVSVLLNSSQPWVTLKDGPNLDFGPVEVGTASPVKEVTVTNTGDAPLVVDRFALVGGDAGQFTIISENCTQTAVVRGFSCKGYVQFAPLREGPARTVLTISDNAPDSPQEMTLTGTGVAPPAPMFAVRPASLDFGNVQFGLTSASKKVVVTNSGTAPMTINSTAISGTDAADFVTATDGCAAHTLAPGGTCTVSVMFRPRDFGPRTGALAFVDTASGSPHSVALKGRSCHLVIGTSCL